MLTSRQSLQLYVARVGVEKGIFNILAETQGTITNAALAEKAGIDPFLLSKYRSSTYRNCSNELTTSRTLAAVLSVV